MDLLYSALTSADVAAWSALTETLARFDETDEFYAPEDLAEELVEPGFEAGLDSVAVWAGQNLVAFGQLRVMDSLRAGDAKASIDGGVHPDHRHKGIGREIMDRLEDRALDVAAARHPGAPLLIDVWAGRADSSAARMAAARGYVPVRYFSDMRVELGDKPGRPTTTRESPAGQRSAAAYDLDVATFSPTMAEAVRVTHNEAFADHWGSSPRSTEGWAAQLASRSFRPDFSRVVLANGPRDGRDHVEAYLLSAEGVPGELYVSLLGTAPRVRGRGLASRMLSDVVGAAGGAGYRTVGLTVDSESPTGAGRIYERAGFLPVRTHVVYQRREVSRPS